MPTPATEAQLIAAGWSRLERIGGLEVWAKVPSSQGESLRERLIWDADAELAFPLPPVSELQIMLAAMEALRLLEALVEDPAIRTVLQPARRAAIERRLSLIPRPRGSVTL